jgi:hypothetical protein
VRGCPGASCSWEAMAGVCVPAEGLDRARRAVGTRQASAGARHFNPVQPPPAGRHTKCPPPPAAGVVPLAPSDHSQCILQPASCCLHLKIVMTCGSYCIQQKQSFSPASTDVPGGCSVAPLLWAAPRDGCPHLVPLLDHLLVLLRVNLQVNRNKADKQAGRQAERQAKKALGRELMGGTCCRVGHSWGPRRRSPRPAGRLLGRRSRCAALRGRPLQSHTLSHPP